MSIEGNLKLTVFDSFPYHELKKVCDAICALGYGCRFVDNGNIVFDKVELKPIKREDVPMRTVDRGSF